MFDYCYQCLKFMDRLSFKQYIKNKRHRFGIKEFKLCILSCYTIALKVYAGKDASHEDSVGDKNCYGTRKSLF